MEKIKIKNKNECYVIFSAKYPGQLLSLKVNFPPKKCLNF